MRQYKENIEFEKENKGFSLAAIEKYWPNCDVEEVTDLKRQKQGIDFIVKTDSGPVNIDVKLRRMEKIAWHDPSEQDVLIEYMQNTGPGWAVHPDAKTDVVLYVWPDLINTEFDWCLKLPYKACKIMAMNRQELLWAGRAKGKTAWNGVSSSAFILVKIKELHEIVMDLKKELLKRKI